MTDSQLHDVLIQAPTIIASIMGALILWRQKKNAQTAAATSARVAESATKAADTAVEAKEAAVIAKDAAKEAHSLANSKLQAEIEAKERALARVKALEAEIQARYK